MKGHNLIVKFACAAAFVAAGLTVGAGAAWAEGHGDDGHAEEIEAWLMEELSDDYDAPVEGLDAADAEAGATAYQGSCAGCHGATGVGDGPAAATMDPPPSDLTHSAHYSDAGYVHIISVGIPETSMPGFAEILGEQSVLDVYAYIMTLQEHEGDEHGDEGDEHGDEGDEHGDEGDEHGDEGDEHGDEGDEHGDEGDEHGDEGDEHGDEAGEAGAGDESATGDDSAGASDSGDDSGGCNAASGPVAPLFGAALIGLWAIARRRED